MLYIGKFINNFKDFYNDINSATLTGAIDVIVVKQPDGSYVCSPFHVRFGKIGVLRSKEKVVDIEVNGVPVDIHMKLGESGEAFFVEEVCHENEIPAYLATSPLPDVPNIEAELEKMKISAGLPGIEQTKQRLPSSSELSNLAQTFKEKDLVLNINSSNFNDCDIVDSSSTHPNTISTSSVSKPQQISSKLVTNQPEDATNNTDSSEEYKTKRRRRKKVSSKKRSKPKDIPSTKNASATNRQTEIKNVETSKPEEIFQMDELQGEDEGFDSTSALSRSVSLPLSANIDDLFGHEWSRRKMSSTFVGEFHPFSDGDVTPQTSPIASRPPSPKSDTEYENQKVECGSPDLTAPSWGWGQLPNVPKNLSDNNLQNQDGEASGENGEMKDAEDTTDAEKRSMLGGMLNFMRSTKKIRHMPESEGIYLSELNSDELDPELAALYFPKFKSTYNQPCPVKDEDTESGNGPSLPHSPHTLEGYGSPNSLSQDSDSDERLSDQFSKEKCESISYPYSDIAMSLCGGLQDPEIDLPSERFLHSMVTFDEFTENPAILQDPSLVIRIGGKFYNWPTAASMLTSIIMFNRPLPEQTANKLIIEHMPKKKKKSYSSWWSWRKSEAEISGIENSLPNPNDMSALLSPTAEEPTEMKLETMDQNLFTAQGPDAPFINKPTKESVQEMVSPLTDSISEDMNDELLFPPDLLDEEDPMEEVVVESETSADEQTDVPQVPPSSESSTMSSSPINIANPLRPQVEITPSLTPPPPPLEAIAQSSFSAKEELTETLDIDEKTPKEKYMKSLRLTTKQIQNLNLKEGPNEFVFSVTTAYQGTTKCTCQVFLWSFDDKIVISDIDGTITRSDVLGHILPIVGHSWAQLGVAKLFTKIQSNGYKFLYLSARAIGQARITREYLRKVRQGEICLPDGPLLLSPTSLISALHREVIERKPEEFKISCLKDIQTLFPPFMGNPFYAGFGNKINDQWAYRAVGIPLTRSFTINHRGELKLELIQNFQSSYTRLSDDVDHVFPPLKPRMKMNGHPTPIFSSPEEFSYFTYWREPPLALSEEDDLML